MGTITLILGGARSGKSGFAQKLAARLVAAEGGGVTYLATAAAKDEEMRLRIARHRDNRPAEWTTAEEPCRVARILAGQVESTRVVIVDCLTLLISNILLAEGAEEGGGPSRLERLEGLVMTEIDDILKTCRRIPAQVLLVANEVGMGVVPPSALGRMFRDIAGRVNQKVAAEADGVYFLVAGLAQKLK